MPGYVKKALTIFQHKAFKIQNQLFPHTPIKYGTKKQYAKTASTEPAIVAKGKKFIRQVCGKFLFYGRTVNSTLLMPISVIVSQSVTPTTDTLAHTSQLPDYLASQEEAVLTYECSDVKLAVHSDASYLSEPKARSRARGHFFLSHDKEVPRNNGAILNIAHIIKHVMSLATEAELAALYIMAREAVYIRIILEEMGHKQPPTPIQTDNAMADAVINGKVQPKRTKGHGHALSLATRQRMPATIQILLVSWQNKLCGLLDQTSFGNTPCQYSQGIFNPLHCSRNVTNEENEHGRGQSRLDVPHRALARV